MIEISSVHNPLIKKIKSLQTKEGRIEHQQFIAEGLRTIETISHTMSPLLIVYTPEMKNVAGQLAPQNKRICVSPAVMKKISTATTPSGLLGLFQLPEKPSKKLTPGLVLAQIADPGNMGTLIRTAAACGITSIVIIEGTDPWSPKVVQSSAGTIGQVTIFQWEWSELLSKKEALILYALVVKGGAPLSQIEPQKALIIVGNEATGILHDWLTGTTKITLTMPGGTESLNAAIAGSIALYETFCTGN